MNSKTDSILKILFISLSLLWGGQGLSAGNPLTVKGVVSDQDNYPLAGAINKKIEAMKSHHHFAWDTMSSAMMNIYQPKVVVSQSFYDHQPDMGHDWKCNGASYELQTSHEFQNAWKAYAVENIADKNWYFTNLHTTVASTYPDEVAKMRGKNGHVVIRVKEGGDEFYVYMLDDNDFEYKVVQIDGPFTCHK